MFSYRTHCAPYSTLSDVWRKLRAGAIRSSVGSNVLVVPGHEVIDGLTVQGQIDAICVHLAVLQQRALQVHDDKVVIELQHAHLSVL